MTRRLTIDDATEFEVAGRVDGQRATIRVSRVAVGVWVASYDDRLDAYDQPIGGDGDTPQAALDAAIAAGAVIDEGDET